MRIPIHNNDCENIYKNKVKETLFDKNDDYEKMNSKL